MKDATCCDSNLLSHNLVDSRRVRYDAALDAATMQSSEFASNLQFHLLSSLMRLVVAGRRKQSNAANSQVSRRVSPPGVAGCHRSSKESRCNAS